MHADLPGLKRRAYVKSPFCSICMNLGPKKVRKSTAIYDILNLLIQYKWQSLNRGPAQRGRLVTQAYLEIVYISVFRLTCCTGTEFTLLINAQCLLFGT